MPCTVLHRHDDAAPVVLDVRVAARERAPAPRRSRGRHRSGVRRRSTSICSPPTRRLSSSGVPRSMTRPWSMTAISSASRSASSRYCVVSRVVMPLATSSSMRSHIALRLRGSRPVVGSSRKSTDGSPDEAHGDVEPSAHAARVRADGAVGRRRRGRTARAAHRRGAWRRVRFWWKSRPTCSRFSNPVSRSSTAAY